MTPLDPPTQKLTKKDFVSDQEVRWCPGCGDYAILAAMQRALPEMALRRNYPYRGTADGHTTGLRRRFGKSDYAGIEIEINQRLIGTAQERRVSLALCDALAVTLRRRDARALRSDTVPAARRDRPTLARR